LRVENYLKDDLLKITNNLTPITYDLINTPDKANVFFKEMFSNHKHAYNISNVCG